MFTVIRTTNFDNEVTVDAFETKEQAMDFLATEYEEYLKEELKVAEIVRNENEGDFAYIEYEDADQVRWNLIEAKRHRYEWYGYWRNLEKAFCYYNDYGNNATIAEKEKLADGIACFALIDYATSNTYCLWAELKEDGELVVMNSRGDDIIIGRKCNYGEMGIIDLKFGCIEDADTYRKAVANYLGRLDHNEFYEVYKEARVTTQGNVFSREDAINKVGEYCSQSVIFRAVLDGKIKSDDLYFRIDEGEIEGMDEDEFVSECIEDVVFAMQKYNK